MIYRNFKYSPSVKLRWGLTVGIIFFSINLIFTLFIFNDVYQQLWKDQKDATVAYNELINTRTDEIIGNLNIKNVEDSLKLISPEATNNSDFTNLDKKQLGKFKNVALSQPYSVDIYNEKGNIVFSSAKKPHPLLHPSKKSVIDADSQNIIVTSAIISPKNHTVKGYVRIENDLSSLRESMKDTSYRLAIGFIVMFFISIMFGYFFSGLLLKPLQKFNDVISKIIENPKSNVRINELRRHDEFQKLVNSFNHMLDYLDEYYRMQSQFVGDASHELRTPLSIVEGHLKLLSRWGKDDPQVLEESLDLALTETKRMNMLINEMLMLTRSSQPNIKNGSEVIDITPIIKQTYRNFVVAHQDFKITLQFIGGQENWLQIKPHHLERILLVLLENGVNYSKDIKELNIIVEQTEHMVTIKIQDFGIGIDKENISKVFNRFYRIDKARSRVSGGTGLGLSIAQSLTEGYGGSLKVQSVLGHGTTFSIIFPIDEDDPRIE